MVRDYARITIHNLNLNISYDNCYQPTGELDIIDLIMLDYIHRLPLFCRPYTTDNPNDYPQYYSKDNFMYTEVSYPELCEMYACINTLNSFNSKQFNDKLSELESKGFIRSIEADDCILFRTTGLYDEYVL